MKLLTSNSTSALKDHYQWVAALVLIVSVLWLSFESPVSSFYQSESKIPGISLDISFKNSRRLDFASDNLKKATFEDAAQAQLTWINGTQIPVDLLPHGGDSPRRNYLIQVPFNEVISTPGVYELLSTTSTSTALYLALQRFTSPHLRPTFLKPSINGAPQGMYYWGRHCKDKLFLDHENLDSRQFTISSTGALRVLPLPGETLDEVVYLRQVEAQKLWDKHRRSNSISQIVEVKDFAYTGALIDLFNLPGIQSPQPVLFFDPKNRKFKVSSVCLARKPSDKITFHQVFSKEPVLVDTYLSALKTELTVNTVSARFAQITTMLNLSPVEFDELYHFNVSTLLDKRTELLKHVSYR